MSYICDNFFMRPFGETVLAWRLARGMTQTQLARAARVPRTNLSAVERGDREVTLRTLRALALALNVRPGALVDGETPGASASPLTRAQMERIAEATVRGTSLSDPREATLARWLAASLSSQLRPVRRRSSPRQSDRAYFLLRSAEPPEVIASLVTRVVEKLPRA
jgi:transcriptional regulator with XRE-family HTH domain